jgi:protein-tyrosine phosphatase
MTRIFKSHLLFWYIQFQRIVDHLWRFSTGLPQMKRSEITPHLYLGGQYHLKSLNRLSTLGVTGIVNMRTTTIHKAEVPTMKICNLPTVDKTAPTLENLKKGVQFITEQVKNGGKVYIHCRMGEERGATMTIAYLISTGLTYEDAYALVKSVRTFIRPIPAQIARLREFENTLVGVT